MRIGITYDLRSQYLSAGFGDEETAEFDREETIQALQQALRQLGHQPQPIGHARQLITALAAGTRWDLVFNICEGLAGAGREAQVPSILDVYQIPYTFADPVAMSVCLDKRLTKLVVAQLDIPTPRSQCVAVNADLAGIRLAYPLFAKPVAEGTSKGISAASRIDDADQLASVCQQLWAQHRQSVLVEEYLPGREFTVGLLGSGNQARVLGTLEIVLREGAEADIYSYVNKEQCEQLVEYRYVSASDPVVALAEADALAAWRALDCRDAGRIDFRCDAQGRPQFLEANPLAGLHPTHSDLPMLCTALQIPYVELVANIVDSAARRAAPADPRLAALDRVARRSGFFFAPSPADRPVNARSGAV